MGISFPKPTQFSDTDRAFLLTLAHYCAQALERARLYEIEAQARIAGEVFDLNTQLQAEITRRKQLEDDLRSNLVHEKELNDLKTQFMSIMSHEFRTPLAVILSSAELLHRYSDRLPEARRFEHLQKIEACVKHLNRLIVSTFSVVQAEAKKLEFKPELLDLVALCQELVAEMQLILHGSHLIDFSYERTCDPVNLDPQLVQLLITNLLSNAIKYSLRDTKVIFRLSCSATEVTIQVQDFGIGISEADQQRLFEPFYRGTNVSKIAGTGIGLTVVRQAVDLHGGSIQVESQVGSGTTFTVRLPTNPPG